MRKTLRNLFEKLPIKLKEFLRFIFVLGYIPNLKKPKTYNEKINYRKRHNTNKLCKICSDKIKAKDYVKGVVGEEIIIENYLITDEVTAEQLDSLFSEKGSLVVKANHNSGPVYVITKPKTRVELSNICDDLNMQLLDDYGKRKREPWYSEINPRQILVEKFLVSEDHQPLVDYKFHVFKRKDDGKADVILHIDFDRDTNHNRSFFNENLEWLPFHCKYPAIVTQIDRPKNYDKMLEIVRELAKPFSYVRVDLYNIDGKIYFGEMTFAHESGFGAFTSKAYDKWMGAYWQCDPKE